MPKQPPAPDVSPDDFTFVCECTANEMKAALKGFGWRDLAARKLAEAAGIEGMPSFEPDTYWGKEVRSKARLAIRISSMRKKKLSGKPVTVMSGDFVVFDGRGKVAAWSDAKTTLLFQVGHDPHPKVKGAFLRYEPVVLDKETQQQVKKLTK